PPSGCRDPTLRRLCFRLPELYFHRIRSYLRRRRRAYVLPARSWTPAVVESLVDPDQLALQRSLFFHTRSRGLCETQVQWWQRWGRSQAWTCPKCNIEVSYFSLNPHAW